MKTITEHIRNHIYELCRLNPKPLLGNIKELLETEISYEFLSLMANRMIMGAFRYGLIQRGKKSRYDRIGSCIDRLELYKESGNQEHLVDVANLCMAEFMEPSLDNVYFNASDDGIHQERVT